MGKNLEIREILKAHRKIVSILKEHGEEKILEQYPLFFPVAIQGSLDEESLNKLIEEIRALSSQVCRCPLVGHGKEGDSDFSLKELIRPTQRKEGLKEIRDFTKDAKKLIIIDPYFYGGEERSSDYYVQEFSKCSRIRRKHVEAIHIIFSSMHGNTNAIKRGIKEEANLNKCILTEKDTAKIHDRIWIADRKRAIVVGTSLGGIGNRLSFILELPEYDLQAILEFLDDEKLLRP